MAVAAPDPRGAVDSEEGEKACVRIRELAAVEDELVERPAPDVLEGAFEDAARMRAELHRADGLPVVREQKHRHAVGDGAPRRELGSS